MPFAKGKRVIWRVRRREGKGKGREKSEGRIGKRKRERKNTTHIQRELE